MGEAAEVARQPRAAAHLQPAHLGVGEEAVFGQLAPQQRDLGQPPDVPAPGARDGPDPVAVAGQHGDDDLAEGQQRRLRQHPHEAEPGVALEHGPQLVAPLQHLHGDGVATLASRPATASGSRPAGHRLAVAHPRVGRDDHA